MEWLTENWYFVMLGLFLLAKVITILTPTPTDDKLWAKAYALFDVLALNIGRVKETGHYEIAANKRLRGLIRNQ